MQGKSPTRQLVESALLTAITVILILIGYYMPILFFVELFITPIPLILIYIRNDLKYHLTSLAIVFILITITIDPIVSIARVTLLGVLSLSLGYCVKNKKSSTFSIFTTSLVVFFTIAINIKLSALILGKDIIALYFETISKSTDIMTNMYKSMGMPQEQIDLLLKTIPSIETLKLLLPFGIIMGSIILGLTIYLISAILLRKFGYNLEKVKPFSAWYLPMELMIVFLVIILIAFGINASHNPNAQMYIVNIMQIFTLVVTINGLAAVSFILEKKNISKALRIVIILFLIFSQLSNLLYFAGIIDYVLDYRKLDPKRKSFKLR